MSKTTPTDRAQKGGYAAPIKIDSAARAARVDDARRVAIFELDDVVYDMPAVVRADIALTYLDLAHEEGEDAAAHYLITATLGRPAFDALMGTKGLTDDDLEGIMVRVKALALPKAQEPTTDRQKG